MIKFRDQLAEKSDFVQWSYQVAPPASIRTNSWSTQTYSIKLTITQKLCLLNLLVSKPNSQSSTFSHFIASTVIIFISFNLSSSNAVLSIVYGYSISLRWRRRSTLLSLTTSRVKPQPLVTFELPRNQRKQIWRTAWQKICRDYDQSSSLVTS